MTDAELTISTGTTGDTEIDLYADVVENELEAVNFEFILFLVDFEFNDIF